MHDPIRAAAMNVAQAEKKLSEATAVYEQRQAECEVIEGRIEAAKQRCSDIRARVNSGEIPEHEGGGLFSLARADLTDLEFLHSESIRAAQAAEPTQARNELAAAQSMFDRTRDQAEIRALAERARMIDEALTGVLREIASANYRLSHLHSFGSHWAPSPALREAVTLNRAPR